MSDLLSTLAVYVPPTLIRNLLRSSSIPTEAVVERFPAAVLFADVSGFTPLTESLARRGPEGPEELTRLLNYYFSHMIALIEAEGGEVVKFSGDAVTVLFLAQDKDPAYLGHATRRAVQAAEAIQAAMSDFATLQSSAGPISLGMKIGVGAGDVLAMQVGGVRGRWEYVLAGDPLRQVAQAEGQANRGDVVLSPEATALNYSEALPSRPLELPDWSRVQDVEGLAANMRRFIPGGVRKWLAEGLRQWLAVLRPMSVLFVGVAGLDYAQPETVGRLHAFLRAAQETLYRYEGSVNKLAVDDKGTILLALLGAPPYAHEDDPLRAVRCALDLQQLAPQHDVSLLIGVTTGHVFAGPVGSETRREYTVMGDTVNLAARLMKKAGRGGVLCDADTYRKSQERITFEMLPPVHVKGKAEEIAVYRPTTPATRSRLAALSDQEPLIGRKVEVAHMDAALDALLDGQGSILILEGEAGIGKSRLVSELARMVQERGITGLLGAGQSIEQQTPYRAWRDVFASYFALQENTPPADRRQRVETLIKQLAPDQIERMPLLNDVLSLAFSETDLTASLDPTLRQQSLFLLLVNLLQAWAKALPLVLVVEDAHWLDSVSWELLVQVARALNISGVALFLVVVTRPLEQHTAGERYMAALQGLESATTLSLEVLSAEETTALVAKRLSLSSDDLPQSLVELVHERAEGNPFFAEEMAFTLRDQGVIRVEEVSQTGVNRCVIDGDLSQAVLTLPTTVQGLILARIDRLEPACQLPLKVGSVIGRTFAYPTLYYTLSQHTTIGDVALKAHLDALAILDLTPLEAAEPDLVYIFKHIITQEVAYETLLFAQRRQLHRTVAEWYEVTYQDDVAPAYSLLSPYYALLVHHYHRAENMEKERYYAQLAGERAAAQFANAEAVRYLSRALVLTPEHDHAARYDLLLEREQVYDVQGEREAQAEDLSALTTLANVLQDDERRADVALRYAAYYEAISDFPAALKAAKGAVQWAKRAEAPQQEVEGLIGGARALWRQGQFEEAREQLMQALDLARDRKYQEGEANSLHNLGTVLYFIGDHEGAQTNLEKARTIRLDLGNRRGAAISLNNLAGVYHALGDFSRAKEFSEQALTIYQSIGDRRSEAQAYSNLGSIYHALGELETAHKYHKQSLMLFKVIDDRRGEALAAGNLGLVLHDMNDDLAARHYCEQALEIGQMIGDREGEGYSLTYLGVAFEGLEQFAAAREAYQNALKLRRDIGQEACALDDLAGLARVALKLGQLEQALAYVEEIQSWIEKEGVSGVEYPLRVYLSVVDVLLAAQQSESADKVLNAAYVLLFDQADRISDESVRRAFLDQVPLHREIQVRMTD